MRWKACVVLAAILCAVLAPQSMELMVRDGHLMIGSLDVCHSAAPALSANGAMPCLSQSACGYTPLLTISYSPIPDFPCTFFQLPRRTDKPPKA